MSERGFHDCRECHGEGVVKQWAMPERPSVSDYAMEGNEESITVETLIVPCPDCEKRRAAIKKAEGRAMPSYRTAREAAHWLNANMVEGQALDIPGYVWSRWGPRSMFAGLIGYENAYDEMMSNLIGSGWGGWTINREYHRDVMVVRRHPTGDKRTYTDPDRRHLYREINGELVSKEGLHAAAAVAEIARTVLVYGSSAPAPADVNSKGGE